MHRIKSCDDKIISAGSSDRACSLRSPCFEQNVNKTTTKKQSHLHYATEWGRHDKIGTHQLYRQEPDARIKFSLYLFIYFLPRQLILSRGIFFFFLIHGNSVKVVFLLSFFFFGCAHKIGVFYSKKLRNEQ